MSLVPDHIGRAPSIQRVNTATTTVIAAGYRSWSVFVVAAASTASPTLAGVALPVNSTVEFSAPDNETMGGATLVTSTGDDVIVTCVL